MSETRLAELVKRCIYGCDPSPLTELDEVGHPPVDPAGFVLSCLERKREGRAAGRLLAEHFERPDLLARYPDEELNFLVPEGYSADIPAGLMVLLHGGGDGTPRDAGRNWLLNSDGSGGYHFRAELERQPYISVAPGNLLLPTSTRWSNPQSDAYLLAVIEEAAYRYNIDPERVYLLGQSMGGFGAYHTVQTIGDRFASVAAHAGAWYFGFWEGLRGTDFYIMHGCRDAVLGTRPRYTDVPFARFAAAILSGLHIPHTYREHEGGHSFSDPLARQAANEFLDYAAGLARERFPERVVTASRKGAFDLYDAPHHHWVTIDQEHNGSFELDHIEPTESTPSYCTTDFRHRTIRQHGGTVDARYLGENRFEVTTHNVERISLWLSPEMVDFARPVDVRVNGEPRFHERVRPSLRVAVESYLRKRDEGRICGARIDLTVKIDDWRGQARRVPG